MVVPRPKMDIPANQRTILFLWPGSVNNTSSATIGSDCRFRASCENTRERKCAQDSVPIPTKRRRLESGCTNQTVEWKAKDKDGRTAKKEKGTKKEAITTRYETHGEACVPNVLPNSCQEFYEFEDYTLNIRTCQHCRERIKLVESRKIA